MILCEIPKTSIKTSKIKTQQTTIQHLEKIISVNNNEYTYLFGPKHPFNCHRIVS